ncbi:MAG: hypothetical protein GX922_01540 [Firmicutes bacterium]|nr:hypothetical protein [Bacillota bacterium]
MKRNTVWTVILILIFFFFLLSAGLILTERALQQVLGTVEAKGAIFALSRDTGGKLTVTFAGRTWHWDTPWRVLPFIP